MEEGHDEGERNSHRGAAPLAAAHEPKGPDVDADLIEEPQLVLHWIVVRARLTLDLISGGHNSYHNPEGKGRVDPSSFCLAARTVEAVNGGRYIVGPSQR